MRYFTIAAAIICSSIVAARALDAYTASYALSEAKKILASKEELAKLESRVKRLEEQR